MKLKSSYTNKEVKNAITEAIQTVKNLQAWAKGVVLTTVKSGDMWLKLTKEQRQMVVASLMPRGAIGSTSDSDSENPSSNLGGAGQTE